MVHLRFLNAIFLYQQGENNVFWHLEKGGKKEKVTHFPNTLKNIFNDKFDSLKALLFPLSSKCLEQNNCTRVSATSASKVIRLTLSSL